MKQLLFLILKTLKKLLFWKKEVKMPYTKRFIYNFLTDFNRVLNIFSKFYLTYSVYASHFIFSILSDNFSAFNYISLSIFNYFLLFYLTFFFLTIYFIIYIYIFLKNFLQIGYIMIFHYKYPPLL